MKIPSSNLGRICCVQKLFLTFRTISAKRRAYDKYLPVLHNSCTGKEESGLKMILFAMSVHRSQNFKILHSASMAFWINIYGCQPHPRHGTI
jgi:hypothetical protein